MSAFSFCQGPTEMDQLRKITAGLETNFLSKSPEGSIL